MRSTTENRGTVRFAPMTNSREQCRISPVFSASGPTMFPGVSDRDRIGMSKASQSCMNRAALSEASESIAPPRWCGLLAIRPRGRPSIRMKAVTIARPNRGLSSSTEPVSAMSSITLRMS